MTVWKTLSPKPATTPASTSRVCSVRESYMVASSPSMVSFGLSLVETLSIVSISKATPRMAKYSHSSGTSTPSAQASALTVSSPSEGWQSISTMSYSGSNGASTRPSMNSRPTSCTSWTSAPDRSMLLGSRSMPSTLVGNSTSRAVTPASISTLYTVASSSCGWKPRPTDRAPCGSKSTSSTRRPTSASAAPRLMVVVVLPTPHFWLQTATTRAGPCRSNGSGSGNTGSGRPVGPSVLADTSVSTEAATTSAPPRQPRTLRTAAFRTLGPALCRGKPTHRLQAIQPLPQAVIIYPGKCSLTGVRFPSARLAFGSHPPG